MKKIIFILAVAGFCASSFGQLDRSIRPTAGPAPVLQIKDPQVFTLDNGLKVILSENHKLPTVAVYYNSPSDLALENSQAGTGDMMGDLLLSGTKNRDKDTFDKEKDFIALTISASANGLYIQTLKKNLDKAADLFTDVLFNPAFPQSEIDRLKKQYASNLIAGKSSADVIGRNVTSKLIYGSNNPQGEIMTEATLENINRDGIIDAYQRMFTPNGGYLTIVGDMTLAEAKDFAHKNFDSWKGQAPYKATYTTINSTDGNRVIFVNKKGAVQSKIIIAIPLDIKKGDANEMQFNVTNQILGAPGFAGRFMQNLREKKAYTYGAYSHFNVSKYGSYFAASGDFRNEVTDSAITQFIYELDRIGNSDVTTDELKEAKEMMTGQFARSLQNASTFASFAYNIYRYNLPSDYYKTYLQRLNSVSAEDVLSEAQKFINPKKLLIIVVGNEDVVNKLKQFDADGVIEKLDAYGEPIKEMKPADITKEQLMDKYILLNTKSTSMKEALKKIKKVKSMQQEVEMTSAQIPMPMTFKQYFQAPNKTASTLEIQGMLIQRQYFNGKTGGQFAMQQGDKEMTADEIKEAQKDNGLFPEANYIKNNVQFELIGIENQNGKDYYVVKRDNPKGETYDYYGMDGQKVKSTSIIKAKDENGEEQTHEMTNTFDDYRDVNGFMMPYKLNILIGPMSMDGTVKSIKLNEKIDKKVFEKK